jgi:predicted XRE-type DNA-binding protein
MKVERSSGSVFRDLGFSPKEAESLRLRAELMVELKRQIQVRELTQSSAAKLFGVTQPRMSDLVRGENRPVQHRGAGRYAGESRKTS